MFFRIMNTCVKKAVDTINKIHSNQDFEFLKDDLLRTIISTVHVIADCEERIRGKLSVQDDGFIRGFLYINNQIKHDTSLNVFYYEVYNFSFPLSFPFTFGKPGVRWYAFTDNGSKNARGKRKHYEEHLMNKDVETTLLLAQGILNKYSA